MDTDKQSNLISTNSQNEVLVPLGCSSTGSEVTVLSSMINRHGLICGATGTGKTVTLQLLAEQLSRRGVSIFSADIKGDLSGLASPGKINAKLEERIKTLGMRSVEFRASPVVFWDVLAANGHPLRVTISELGPLLLSHMLELNDVQEGVLHICFKVADDEGLLLLDLKDLREMLIWIAEHRSEISTKYGNIAAQSLGAIQRRLLVLEELGAEKFFGEPSLQIKDFIQQDLSGNGIIHLLDATKLVHVPKLYSAFLLWILSELFEELPEVGDRTCPKLVFFFDESHLLFDSATKELVRRFEQVIRLIRSKGVGIFFVTQHPSDIPETILSQLGNRIIHALRAYTPREQKAVRSAGESMRQNPEFIAHEVIPELAIGEALVSVLDENGKPQMAERTLIRPPASRIGPCNNDERHAVTSRSPYSMKYDQSIDRESAYEILRKRAETIGSNPKIETKKSKTRQGIIESFFKSLMRSAGYRIGKEIARGALGSILKSKRY